MKILVVHNDHRFGGGSDVVAAATAGGLRARSHEVERFWRDSRTLGAGLRGRWRAFASGIRAPDALRDFAAALERFRPDLVHAHEVYPLIGPGIFAECARRRVPAVLTCHDYRLTCPVCVHYRGGALCTECAAGREWPCLRHNCRGRLAESLAYALRNRVARRSGLYGPVAAFATPTRFTRDWLVEHAGLDPRRVRAVGNPVVPPRTAASYEPASRTYVAYVGRFAPEKGVDLLWRAAARAGLPLQLAGDHREYRPPFARAENRFHGALGGDDLERFFQGARLLVVPSLWFETYGMVVAEAMMRGVPVLCSDIGALSEMVEDGRTGRLFPPGDEDALVRRLGEMWSDAAALARLSDAARERARDFGPGPYFDRIETLYREAMALP